MRIKHLTQATSAKYKTTAVCASMKQMLPAHCPPQALHIRDTENKSKSVGAVGTRGTSEESGDIDLGSFSVL